MHLQERMEKLLIQTQKENQEKSEEKQWEYQQKQLEIGVTWRKFVFFWENLAQLSTHKLHSAPENLWINIYWSSRITDGTLQSKKLLFLMKDGNVLIWLEKKKILPLCISRKQTL